MKEPHIEGVATHDGPESCGCILQRSARSVDRGRGGLGIEPRKQANLGADGVIVTGRQHGQAQERERLSDPAWSETPCTQGHSVRGSWEILGSLAEDGTAGRIGKAESRTPMMHDQRKSDDSVVSKKSSNKGGLPSAEGMEKRESTKGNAEQQTTRRTQSRASVSHELSRVREAAKRDRRPSHRLSMRSTVLTLGALRSPTPKVGAQCASCARWDLCGGRPDPKKC